jgi:hypothetical protein
MLCRCDWHAAKLLQFSIKIKIHEDLQLFGEVRFIEDLGVVKLLGALGCGLKHVFSGNHASALCGNFEEKKDQDRSLDEQHGQGKERQHEKEKVRRVVLCEWLSEGIAHPARSLANFEFHKIPLVDYCTTTSSVLIRVKCTFTVLLYITVQLLSTTSTAPVDVTKKDVPGVENFSPGAAHWRFHCIVVQVQCGFHFSNSL